MRASRLVPVLALLLAAGIFFGLRIAPTAAPAGTPARPVVSRPPPKPADRPDGKAPADRPGTAADPTEPAPREFPPVDIAGRLTNFEEGDIGKIEEEWEARLMEDPKFADQMFQAFLAEPDPTKQSFLQNLLATQPHLRNSPEWQDRFMGLAENDPDTNRRAAALLFLQQAESIRSVRDRLVSLVEHGRDIRVEALVTLDGLPERRGKDPQLVELAGRLAESDPDPVLRGVALRIENNPDRAVRALNDADKEVRMQACWVVTSREALQQRLQGEKDPEVRDALEQRITDLGQNPPR